MDFFSNRRFLWHNQTSARVAITNLENIVRTLQLPWENFGFVEGFNGEDKHLKCLTCSCKLKMKLSPLQIKQLCPKLTLVCLISEAPKLWLWISRFDLSQLFKKRHKYPWNAFRIGKAWMRILVLHIWPMILSVHNYGLSWTLAKCRTAQGNQPQTNFPCYLRVPLKCSRGWSQCHNPNTSDSCALWDTYLGEGLKHCFVNWFHACSTGLSCLLDIVQPFPPG